jgi:WD40 repeat protein/DNA-binding SARP family transcriptional activator
MTATPHDRTSAASDDDPTGLVADVDERGPDLHIRGVRVAQGARIAVLGPLRIGGVRPRITPRDRVVLEALSIRVGDNVSTDWLADALWGESPPASAAKNLQGCIARLRKELGHDAIETTASGYRLVLPPDDIDSHAFEHLVQRGRELLALGEPDRAAYVVGEALALFAGEPLEDLGDWDLGVLEAERLREVRWGAEELRVDALLGSGQHDEALSLARALLAEQPLRERRHVQLALSQYRTGQQVEALATLRQLRERLLDELGVDPGPEATALEQSILLQDPGLMVAAASGQGTSCPWPGLTSYGVEDHESFCGRDIETVACLRLLHERGVLAVVGPSGSGKSSLLRAGIAASLRTAGREVSVVTPGRAGPSQADSIARTPIGTVLLVDQLEEAFAPGVTPEHRATYLDALARRGGGGELIVALRADRTPELSAEPEIARILERGWYLLSAMDAAGLRTAIERPARQAGLLVEPGLIDLLLREVQDEPGALPLLSHSLVETWNRREGRTLTVDGYLATGGVRGSIAQSAEAVYGDVPADQRGQLRDLLMRLVAPGPEGEPTRIRISRDRIVTSPEQERLVELLVGSRLVTSDDGNITLAHEALAREWPRLRGWLDDDIEGQRILHHLSGSADAWDAMGRPDSELYRGVRLARALEWSASSPTVLAPVEQSFLDESVRLRSAEERSAEEQIRIQTRSNRRLRVSLAAAVVLLLVAAGLGILAQRSSDRARRSSDRAQQAALAREAEAVGALALQMPDPVKSLLLAVAAARVSPSISTQADLAAALAQRGQLMRTTASPGPLYGQVAVSPDGTRLVVGSAEGTVYLYDAQTLDLLDTYQAGPQVLSFRAGLPVAISPDGRYVAVGVTPPAKTPVLLLSLRDDRFTLLPKQLGGWHGLLRATSITFSADGRRLAAFADRGKADLAPELDPTVLVWDVRRANRPIQRIPTSSNDLQRVLLSPDGATLYTSNPVKAYDVRKGALLHASDQYSAWDAAVNRAGTMFASLHGDEMVLLDPGTLAPVTHLSGTAAGLASMVAFSRDSHHVAAYDTAGTAYVWDLRTGYVTHTVETNDVNPKGLAFSPDGSRLYTTGNAQLQEWDLEGSHSLLTRVRVPDSVTGNGDVSPDGSRMAYVDGDQVGFLDLDTGVTTPMSPFEDAPYIASAWAPDGTKWAHPVRGGRVDVLDPSNGRLISSASTGGAIFDMSYSADGRQLVVAAGHTVEVFDAESMAPLLEPIRLDRPVGTVDPSPDGRLAFVTFLPAQNWHSQALSHSGALVDLVSGRVLRRGELPIDGIHFAAFSPRGGQVAVSGELGQVLLFDTETWKPVAPTVSPNGAFVMSVSYSPDGTRLLTAGRNEARLRDSASGKQIGIVKLPGYAWSAAFRPDGTIRIADQGGEVFTWDPSLAHEIAFACQSAGRDITQDEWHEAFPDLPYRTVCTK